MPFPQDLSPYIVDKAVELKINPEDIYEKFITGGGKGGQKINKTASCMMLKHLPSGTIVKCQKHREQSKNKLSAYKLLILKIEEQVKGQESDLAQKIHKLRKQKQKRTKRAKEKMLEDKANRSQLKSTRKSVNPNQDTSEL